MSETLAGATGLEPATNASWRSQQIQWRRPWSPKPQIFFEKWTLNYLAEATGLTPATNGFGVSFSEKYLIRLPDQSI